MKCLLSFLPCPAVAFITYFQNQPCYAIPQHQPLGGWVPGVDVGIGPLKLGGNVQRSSEFVMLAACYTVQ